MPMGHRPRACHQWALAGWFAHGLMVDSWSSCVVCPATNNATHWGTTVTRHNLAAGKSLSDCGREEPNQVQFRI
eukprot:4311799-Alexandrium_andersonii.AAC.1